MVSVPLLASEPGNAPPPPVESEKSSVPLETSLEPESERAASRVSVPFHDPSIESPEMLVALSRMTAKSDGPVPLLVKLATSVACGGAPSDQLLPSLQVELTAPVQTSVVRRARSSSASRPHPDDPRARLPSARPRSRPANTVAPWNFQATRVIATILMSACSRRFVTSGPEDHVPVAVLTQSHQPYIAATRRGIPRHPGQSNHPKLPSRMRSIVHDRLSY